MKLKSVTFIDSTFRNCYFDDVTSVGSFFRNCTFIDAFFFNTGELFKMILKLSLWHEYRPRVICFAIGQKLWCALLYYCQTFLIYSSFFILWPDIDESKLIEGTEVINSTFTHNKIGCQMTFDDDYSAYWVYFINFLGTLAVLPGNIVSALLMDKIGRLSMLGKNGGYEWGLCATG